MATGKVWRKHLANASSDMARLALDAIASTRSADVASATMRTGMAMEFALRATVANISPALLFMRSNGGPTSAAAMVHAADAHSVEPAWLRAQTSTQAKDIRLLAAARVPELQGMSAEMDTVANRRDAVTHMYVVEPDVLRSTLASLVRVVTVLLPHLHMSADEYWGPERLAFTRQLLDERLSTIRARIADLIRRAEVRLATRMSGLDPEARQHLVTALESRGSQFMPPGPLEVFRGACPACGHVAEILVRTRDDFDNANELDFSDWGEAGPGTALIPQEGVSVQLQCPVCRLRLSYEELTEMGSSFANLLDYELSPRPVPIAEHNSMLWTYEPDADGARRP